MTAADIALNNARLAVANGDVSGASVICRTILEAAPNDPGALILLSEIAETAGQYDLARRFLKQLINAYPDDASYWTVLSKHLDRTGGGGIYDLIPPAGIRDGATYALREDSSAIASTARSDPGFPSVPQPSEFPIRASYLLKADDVIVTENFLPVLRGGRVAREGASLFPLRAAAAVPALSVYPEIKAISDGRLWLQSSLPEREVEGEALLLSGGPVGRQNYFHWVIDYLPRLWALELEAVPDNIRLIVNDHLSAVQRDSLIELGIRDSRLIQKRDDETLHCEHLIIPSFLTETGRMSTATVRFLQRLVSDETSEPRRLIYISRRMASSRRLVNEEAVESMLMEFGFDIVIAENLSFIEQVQLFSSAGLIVGPHGGGFANIAFAPATAHILEIATKPHTAVASLAAAGGQPYWSLQSDIVTPAQQIDQTTYRVSLEDLKRLLDHVLAQLPRQREI